MYSLNEQSVLTCFHLKQQFQFMNRNNNIDAINPTQSPQTLPKKHSASLHQKKLKTKKQHNNSIPTIPEQRHDESNSQFLDLQPEMMQKLKKIEQSNKSNEIKNVEKRQSHKQNSNANITRKQNSTIRSKLNKSVEENSDKNGKMYLKRQQQDRLKQENIKKQFVNKLKQWSKQKQQIDKKKVYIQEKKQFLSQELQSKKLKEKEEEEQFIKLEKRKQIQQKIHQIQERRRKRQESLKNAVLRRSYNGVPKYLEYEEKFNAQQEQETLVNLKLMKNKKQKMTLDPQQLKAHEKAYIERIKERLNMNSKKSPKKDNESQQRRTNSDFNLYLKRSEELKKVQLQKIIRRKKFQEKISKIPIKIDDQKKNEILISKDKAKNPQKYHILSQKALNDQQIYSQFKDFNINLDPKQLGDDYLQQLKSSPKKIRSRSRSQVIIKNVVAQPLSFKLPVVQKYQTNISKSVKNLALPQIKPKIVVPKSESRSYEQTLKLKKQKDSKYMKQLQKKLAFLD